MATQLTTLLTLVALCLFVGIVRGRPSYKNKIPNGHNIPHPCTPNTDWAGVGHWLMGGSGALNPFGEAFRDAGFVWTVALCNSDSDNDGLTNGEELGDPDCVWVEGDAPLHVLASGISHPGICQPVNSSHCRRQQPSFTCDGDVGYECPSLYEQDVRHVDLRLPPTPVPQERTTYYCTIFEVPSDVEYHAIAFEPIVDNLNVLHHMMLYGCGESVTGAKGPSSCGMSDVECLSLVALWNVGADGICMHENLGMRFGRGSFKFLSLQTHWNNPEHATHYQDSSGMRMYYTPHLRQFDQEVIMMGQTDINIPARRRETVIEGVCPASCTEEMPHPINVIYANLHMHYLGQSGKVEIYRDGVLQHTVLNELESSYEVPIMHTFDPPLELLPGDEIKTTCRYNTLDGQNRREHAVFYGEGTENEMCYTTLWYYPAITGFECVQHGEYLPCGESCTYDGLYQQLDDMIRYMLWTGICGMGSCSDRCYAYLWDMLRDHCFRNYVESIRNNQEAMADPYTRYYLRIDSSCLGRYRSEN